MGRLDNSTVSAKKEDKALQTARFLRSPSLVARFADVLGGQEKANQFVASVISCVNGNNNLAQCDPVKIFGCAMIAASLNLDINPNLGFASIVPYKDGKTGNYIPQFQMGWKGFVQLALRTKQYKTMNVTEVYDDEFESYDPFKGELKWHIVNGGDRDNGRLDKIVGYAFYFELVSGFSKMSYMSKIEALNHAMRYSKAYQADIKYKTKSSPWSTLFDAMAEKTIVKNTLSKWGILSTQMALAQKADFATVTERDGSEEFQYMDEAKAEEPIEDAKAEVIEPSDEPSSTPSDDTQGEMFSEEDLG